MEYLVLALAAVIGVVFLIYGLHRLRQRNQMVQARHRHAQNIRRKWGEEASTTGSFLALESNPLILNNKEEEKA
jgi:hypothetical protein